MLFSYLESRYIFGKVEVSFFGKANCIIYSEDRNYCLALDFTDLKERTEFTNRIHSQIKEINLEIINIEDCLAGLKYEEVFCNLNENPSSLDSYFNIKKDKEIFLRFYDCICYFGNLTDLFNLDFNSKGELKFFNNGLLNLITLYDYDGDLWSNLKTEMMYSLIKNNTLILDFNSNYFKNNCSKLKRSQDFINYCNKGY